MSSDEKNARQVALLYEGMEDVARVTVFEAYGMWRVEVHYVDGTCEVVY
jgi:hypothetical protein